jgi:hypothetical protein
MFVRLSFRTQQDYSVGQQHQRSHSKQRGTIAKLPKIKDFKKIILGISIFKTQNSKLKILDFKISKIKFPKSDFQNPKSDFRFQISN